MRRRVRLFFLLLFTAGCVHDLVPDRSPRVQPAVVDGRLAFARDGRIYRQSPFGYIPTELVHGNADAERLVDEGNSFWTATWILLAGSLAAPVVTPLLVGNASDTTMLESVGIMMGMEVVSIITLELGIDRQYEGMNRFNDSVGEPIDARPVR